MALYPLLWGEPRWKGLGLVPLAAGAVLGALASGQLADRLGRRRLHLLMDLFYLVVRTYPVHFVFSVSLVCPRISRA